jgi:hypothetical protein
MPTALARGVPLLVPARAVELEAVELDRELLLRPVDVDFVSSGLSLDQGIEGGHRKVRRGIEQRPALPLEPALLAARPIGGDHPPQGPAVRSKIPSRSARSTATSRSGGRTTAPRSSSVRATLVTGMPSLVVKSWGASTRVRCTSTQGGPGRFAGTVTSSRVAFGRRPQRSAAERWLRAAPVPHASTAARYRPLSETIVTPTEKTPRCTG